MRFDFSEYAPMSLYEAVVIFALILSVIAVPFARTRMLAIILTGTVGYMVTLFFRHLPCAGSGADPDDRGDGIRYVIPSVLLPSA